MKPTLRIVLDTNVLVSALLKGGTPPGQILELVFTGQVKLVLEQQIFQEYRSVLSRSRFGISPLLAEKLLDFLAVASEWVLLPLEEPALEGILDASDLPFARVALAANAWALVTGNQRHFRCLHEYAIPILTPSEFIDLNPRE